MKFHRLGPPEFSRLGVNRDAATITAVCAILCGGLAGLASAHAQTVKPDGGVALGAQPLAMPSGALSLVANPAGMADLAGAELRLQVALGGLDPSGIRRTDAGGAGWGAFAAGTLGPLRLGAALEHRAEGAGPASPIASLSRLSLGAALPLGDRVALGASTRLLGGAAADGSSPWTSDIGLLVRPWSWLSLGWRVSGLGDPGPSTAGGDVAFLTRYGAGIALRPLAGSHRLHAAFDVEWELGGALTRQQLSLGGEPLRGLGVALQVRGLPARGRPGAIDEVQTTLQLDLGFGHVGTSLALRGDRQQAPAVDGGGDRSGTALLVGARFSTDVPPTLTDPSPEAVIVPLAGDLSERPGRRGFARLLLDLDALARDPAVRLVVLRFDDPTMSWAQVEELRAVIGRIRAAGKRTASYAASLGTRALMVAAATERIGLPPAGTLAARGVGADFIGLGEALRRLGVQVEAVRYGEHKSAPELLTGSAPSAPLRAMLEHHVRRRWTDFCEAVALGRALTPSGVEEALAGGIVDPAAAKAAGIIDVVGESEAFEAALRKDGLLRRGDELVPWEPPLARRTRWGRQERIVVLGLEGDIVDGAGGQGLRGTSIGGTAVRKQLEALRRDDAVRGVVVRVDSGGGAVYGSDLMHQGLLRLSKRKPTVASMGGVAASGGYWLSLGADRIFADRATVTGSIGIWVAKPELSGLLSRLGVGVAHVGLGPGHDALSVLRPWEAADKERVQRSMRRYYDLFLQRVADRRKIALTALAALAEGRLWLGDEAVQRGLVDREAGLLEAIADVRARADLADPDDVRVVLLPRPGLQLHLGATLAAAARFLGLGAGSSDQGDAGGGDDAGVVGARALAALGQLASAAGPWLDRAALLASMPAETPLAMTPLPAAPRGR